MQSKMRREFQQFFDQKTISGLKIIMVIVIILIITYFSPTVYKCNNLSTVRASKTMEFSRKTKQFKENFTTFYRIVVCQATNLY